MPNTHLCLPCSQWNALFSLSFRLILLQIVVVEILVKQELHKISNIFTHKSTFSYDNTVFVFRSPVTLVKSHGQ